MQKVLAMKHLLIMLPFFFFLSCAEFGEIDQQEELADGFGHVYEEGKLAFRGYHFGLPDIEKTSEEMVRDLALDSSQTASVDAEYRNGDRDFINYSGHLFRISEMSNSARMSVLAIDAEGNDMPAACALYSKRHQERLNAIKDYPEQPKQVFHLFSSIDFWSDASATHVSLAPHAYGAATNFDQEMKLERPKNQPFSRKKGFFAFCFPLYPEVETEKTGKFEIKLTYSAIN